MFPSDKNIQFLKSFLNKQQVIQIIKKFGIISGSVNTIDDLPPASEHKGEVWLVETDTAGMFLPSNAGFYTSNGTVWTKIPIEFDVSNKVDKINITPFIKGSASRTVSINVNEQGQVVSGEEYDLESGNITETTKLFYTDERVDDEVADLIQSSTSIMWDYDDILATLTGELIATGADKILYSTGINEWDETGLSAYARTNILNVANELAFQQSVNLEIGFDVQAFNSNLTTIAAISPADSTFLVGNGSTWVAESGATARTSLGLGANDDVTFRDLDVRNAVITNSVASLLQSALVIQGTNSTAYPDIFFENSSGNSFGIGINPSGETNPHEAFIWHYDNYSIRFGTNNTERLRIQGNGKIGAAGNTSASADLSFGTDLGTFNGISYGAAADSEVRLGQSTTRYLSARWDYNATAGSAFGVLECGGGLNDLKIQPTDGGTIIGNTGTLSVLTNGVMEWVLSTGEITFTTPGGDTGIIFNNNETGNHSQFNIENHNNATASSRYFTMFFEGYESSGFKMYNTAPKFLFGNGTTPFSGTTGRGGGSFASGGIDISSGGRTVAEIRSDESIATLLLSPSATNSRDWHINAATDGSLGLFQYSVGANAIYIDSAGDVGIATSSPNANAILDITSTTKGLLLPRNTSNPGSTAGMIVYNSTDNVFAGRDDVGFGNFVRSSYRSAETTITYVSAATPQSFTHSLGKTPILFGIIAICKTAEVGFAVGDIFQMNSQSDGDGARTYGIVANATTIKIYGDGFAGVGAISPTTGNYTPLTAANWKFIAWACV